MKKAVVGFLATLGLLLGVAVVSPSPAGAWPYACTAGRSDTWSNQGAAGSCGTPAAGSYHRVVVLCGNGGGQYWRYGPWVAQGTGWSIARCNNIYWDGSTVHWFNVQVG